VPVEGLAGGAVVVAADEDEEIGLAVAVEIGREEAGVIVGIGAGDAEGACEEGRE